MENIFSQIRFRRHDRKGLVATLVCMIASGSIGPVHAADNACQTAMTDVARLTPAAKSAAQIADGYLLRPKEMKCSAKAINLQSAYKMRDAVWDAVSACQHAALACGRGAGNAQASACDTFVDALPKVSALTSSIGRTKAEAIDCRS